MKKIVFFVIVLLLSGLLVGGFLKEREEKKESRRGDKAVSPSPSVLQEEKEVDYVKTTPTSQRQAKTKECAFVVYWSDFSKLQKEEYDKFLYFGLAPERDGTIQNDLGFKKFDKFVINFKNKERGLVVRLVDKGLAQEFLENKQVWEEFLSRIYSLAKENSFSEVSFDIELSPFQESLREPLVEFLSLASRKAKEYDLTLSFIAYADSFYRKRPFEFEKISKLVDQVYLMAYDFTKSFSEPGPNFPLEAGAWGYSLKQAVKDFSQFFEKDKIIVIFGGFGYKWSLGEDGRPLGRAQALSFNAIEKNYLSGCLKEKSCQVKLEDKAKEKVLKGRNFVIWYEDRQTFELKKEALLNQGISNFCYFALGYF